MTMFSEGLKYEVEEYKKYSEEELKGKVCGGCVRCEERAHGMKGYHCCKQAYDIDIFPTDKACEDWWDKKEHERVEKANEKAQEDRRKELWDIYADKDPVKLPIEFDGFGNIPICPTCGEMPYSTEQCHWCGQKFIQDEETVEYGTPLIEKSTCLMCGAEVDIHISRYNGHKSYACEKCGARMME